MVALKKRLPQNLTSPSLTVVIAGSMPLKRSMIQVPKPYIQKLKASDDPYRAAFAVNFESTDHERAANRKYMFPALKISSACVVSFSKTTPATRPSVNPKNSLRLGFLRARIR